MKLCDAYAGQLGEKLNVKFEKLKAPFRAGCDRKNNLAFYRIGDACTIMRATKTQEKVVANWLLKNTDTTFEELVGRPPVIPVPRLPKEKTAITQEDCPDCNNCPYFNAVKKEVEQAEKAERKKSEKKKVEPKAEVKPEPQKAAPEKQPEPQKTEKKQNDCGIKIDLRMIQGDCATISTESASLDCVYALVSLDALIASHDHETFRINANYPPRCQEREYHSNQQLQLNVQTRAAKLDPRFLISDAPTAEDGPPIITGNGVVLGGNSRVMILRRARESHKEKWKNYKITLYKKIANFGLTMRRYDAYPEHVLVRVINADIDKCAHYSRILNTSTKNEESIETVAFSLSRYLTQRDLEDIGFEIDRDEAESLSQMLNGGSTTQRIIQILRACGAINATNFSKFIKPDGRALGLTEIGKITVEKLLLAAVLKDKHHLGRANTITDAILKNIPFFIKSQGMPKKWDFTQYVPNVIQLEHATASTNEGMYKSRATANQARNMYKSQDELYKEHAIRMTDWDKVVWELLTLPQRQLKEALIMYIKIAESQISNKHAMFKMPDIEPIDAMGMAIRGERPPMVADGRASKMRAERRLADRQTRKPTPKKQPQTLFQRFIAWAKKDLGIE